MNYYRHPAPTELKFAVPGSQPWAITGAVVTQSKLRPGFYCWDNWNLDAPELPGGSTQCGVVGHGAIGTIVWREGYCPLLGDR